MLGTTPLILIVLPLLFQLTFGTLAIFKPLLLKFKTVFIINIILQITFSILSFYIATQNFSKYLEQYPNSNRCGMAFVGLATLIILLAGALFTVIFIQYFIKKSKDRKVKI
ncbi:hypothetical protein [Flavobacterium sp. 245]|uniref:hypothetical protein n=1 Tax=Flavobacterium sp. 245 TaxID=2512115 RepID=UPI00105B4C9F|nr:hypothetical protein [Flavobacterium sp. 245]TDP00353.1 hypothetical protein EV145_106249 [Flavobacterium sp. 245]